MTQVEQTGAERFLAAAIERRNAWPMWKKTWMRFRWKVAQPVRKFPREVRWFIQRGRRGWSDCDLWGMDTYVARLNVEMLAELRKIVHGYPVGLTGGQDEPWYTDEDRARFGKQNREIDAIVGYTGDPNDGFERWKAMLAFFEAGWRAELSYNENYDKEGHETFKAMMPTYADWFSGLWD